MSKQPEHTYYFVNPNSRQKMLEMLQNLAAEQLKRRYRDGKQKTT